MKIKVIVLQTLDGFIAKDLNDDLSWGSKEDKALFLEQIKQVDYKIMGSRTFDTMRNFDALIGKHSKTVVLCEDPDVYKDYINPYSEVLFLNMPIEDVAKYLESLGAENVAVVGGAYVYSSFLKSGLVNELCITIAPHIFGNGIRFASDSLAGKMQLEEIREIGSGEIFLRYNILPV